MDESPLPLSVVARRLRVPVSWLRDEAVAGRVPHLRAGKQILMDPDTVRQVLADRATAKAVGAEAPEVVAMRRELARRVSSPEPRARETPAAPGEILVGAVAAARLLSVSPRTLWQWTKDGFIPHVRLGKTVRYNPRALEAWAIAQSAGSVTAPASKKRHG